MLFEYKPNSLIISPVLQICGQVIKQLVELLYFEQILWKELFPSFILDKISYRPPPTNILQRLFEGYAPYFNRTFAYEIYYYGIYFYEIYFYGSILLQTVYTRSMRNTWSKKDGNKYF